MLSRSICACILFGFVFTCLAVETKAETIYLTSKRKDSAIYRKLEVQPGDTVVLKGNYPYVNVWGFSGTKEKPVVFINEGVVNIGQIEGIGNYGWVFHDAQFFKIQGVKGKYPIRIAGGGEKNSIALAIGKGCTDYTVDNVEIFDASVGVMAKVNPDGKPENSAPNFAIRNIRFTNLYIHDIRGEGMYIGNTKGSSDAPRIYNCEIAFVKTDNTGWDGIQLALCPEGGSIHDCEVSNYGTQNLPNQRNGIVIGGGVNANVYNNYIHSGLGAALVVFGTGRIKVYKNRIENSKEDGIFVDDRPIAGLPPLSVIITDNTISNVERFGIRISNTHLTMQPGQVSRNKIKNSIKTVFDKSNSKHD
jgi:hypothetical protein